MKSTCLSLRSLRLLSSLINWWCFPFSFELICIHFTLWLKDRKKSIFFVTFMTRSSEWEDGRHAMSSELDVPVSFNFPLLFVEEVFSRGKRKSSLVLVFISRTRFHVSCSRIENLSPVSWKLSWCHVDESLDSSSQTFIWIFVVIYMKQVLCVLLFSTFLLISLVNTTMFSSKFHSCIMSWITLIPVTADSSKTFLDKIEKQDEPLTFGDMKDHMQLILEFITLILTIIGSTQYRCADLDTGYGCHKGFCWAYCGLTGRGGDWCYTTKSFSQSFRYERCTVDRDCSPCWKCAGLCSLWKMAKQNYWNC